MTPPPWTIEPDTEIDFLVTYVPSDVGWDRSEVIIESNDPMRPEVSVSKKEVVMSNNGIIKT